MKANIESALWNCGRDRVMHREGADSSGVAIRYDGPPRITSPDGTEHYLVRTAATLDEAGEAAARAFAQRLRDDAASLVEWAQRIERSLAGGAA